MHTRCLWALLGLTACFGEPPPALTAAEGTDGSSGSATTIPSPPSGSATAASTSSSSTSSDDDASTSGPADDESSGPGTTGSSSTEDTGDSGSESSSSSGGAYDGPYGDCWEGPVQSPKGEYLCPPSSCVVHPPDHSACAPVCGGGCEAGPDGAGTACLDTLTAETVPTVCVLPCGGAGGTCPDPMECMESGFETGGGQPLWLCMWP